jgi:hypothetical protein
VISPAQTAKGAEAITSDQWHVVQSRLLHPGERRPYVRSIHSEHGDRLACRKAARALRVQLAKEWGKVPEDERDEIFVRRPGYKSLKAAKTRRDAAE